MKTFYWFTFADGFRKCCAGYSKVEMQHEVLRHGKLINKVRA